MKVAFFDTINFIFCRFTNAHFLTANLNGQILVYYFNYNVDGSCSEIMRPTFKFSFTSRLGDCPLINIYETYQK